jgi:hypothetical protein
MHSNEIFVALICAKVVLKIIVNSNELYLIKFG